jgi:hypothetical protein
VPHCGTRQGGTTRISNSISRGWTCTLRMVDQSNAFGLTS